jgi:methylglyoxal synthase
MAIIALIAHDEKKDSLVQFSLKYKDILEKFDLVATYTTGGHLEKEVGVKVDRMLSGPLGGDLQIGAMVAEGKISAVVFLRDPLTAHAHEPDISALMKVCDTHNIPLATNLATAQIVIERLAQLQWDGRFVELVAKRLFKATASTDCISMLEPSFSYCLRYAACNKARAFASLFFECFTPRLRRRISNRIVRSTPFFSA